MLVFLIYTYYCFLVGELSQERKIVSHKRHCCFFCKKIIFQIVRHWRDLHLTEDEVKEIFNLHSSNPLRRQKINRLRRKGDYEYNKHGEEYIVSRKSIHANTVYVPCPSCFGYFSKKNLRHHKTVLLIWDPASYRENPENWQIIYMQKPLKLLITPDMFHDVTNEIFFY